MQMEVGAGKNFAVIAKFDIQRLLGFQGAFQLPKHIYKKVSPTPHLHPTPFTPRQSRPYLEHHRALRHAQPSHHCPDSQHTAARRCCFLSSRFLSTATEPWSVTPQHTVVRCRRTPLPLAISPALHRVLLYPCRTTGPQP